LNKLAHKQVNLFELLNCLSNANDLVSSQLALHQQQVSYLSFKLAEQLNLSINQKRDMVMSGLLHDIGALTQKDRFEIIENELPLIHDHAFKGAHLIEGFPPLCGVANIIRYHHVPWNYGEGKTFNSKEVPLLSHLVHLADRIAVLVNPNKEIIGQIKEIRSKMLEQ